ncbi:MAG TPA: YicC/YloC family endoribonuclease [Thermodesulfobacteriota bacterium]
MKSMTGFGRSTVESDLGRIEIEARSENHRFLDINFQFPEAISSIEPSFTDIVKKFISRGKIRITIMAEGFKDKFPVINTRLAKEFLKALESLRKELGIKERIRIEHILMARELFYFVEKKTISKEDLDKIEKALREAMKRLDEMRKSEGKKLKTDLKQRALIVEKLTQTIEAKREDFTKELAEKLGERVKELLKDIQIEEPRLYQEVAFLAERSDITEEMVRLKAHINKFKETFNKNGSIGRELDFLLQEMNREAGTISAKSKDAEISHLIVELRSEIEKMREQAQNIE